MFIFSYLILFLLINQTYWALYDFKKSRESTVVKARWEEGNDRVIKMNIVCRIIYKYNGGLVEEKVTQNV